MSILMACSILIAVIFLSCAREASNPLEGAWELVKGEQKSEDSIESVIQPNFQLNPTSCCIVT